ncbi:MAG: sirohydrochlorin chelatase [Cyanobacteria bacterium P01_C01_bin.73]
MASTAYLLVSHGSRDPRPQAAMERLATFVKERFYQRALEKQYLAEAVQPPIEATGALWRSPVLVTAHYGTETNAAEQPQKLTRQTNPALMTLQPTSTQPTRRSKKPSLEPPLTADLMVETACLELAQRPLSEQICEFARRACAQGVTTLKLVPLFLMRGVHVMEDLPAAVNQARERVIQGLGAQDIKLELCSHIGSHAELPALMTQRLSTLGAGTTLLVAHGSRRRGGNKPIAAIARQLNAEVAYWFVQPDLETQIIELMQQGHQRIAILPYFLFSGGITDALTQRMEELAERFPKVTFRLLPPIGASRDLADLVIDLAR